MASSAESRDRRLLDLDADRALFQGEIESIVATFHQNERPLGGLVGLLDWRFHGLISSHLRKGAIHGEAGECAYIPITRCGKTYHLLLVGAGHSDAPGQREQVSESILKVLEKNLASLKLPKLGISRSDFGNVDEDYFSKRLKGVPLWIVR